MTPELTIIPENYGVDTRALLDFFNELKTTGYRFKSIKVLRYGQVVAQSTKYPFVTFFPHTMFSLSKPVTALAIGFAIQEGLLRLDTTLAELFEDTYSAEQLKKVEGITVRHLLTMTSGKSISLFENKEKCDWLDSYVKSKFNKKPGKKFKYISENTYVLGRMLAKVSGQTISEYLRPRLFEPLGMDVKFWEKDRNGFDAGGWGLFLSIDDLAKLAQCMLDNGVYNGIQVIPEGWVEEMTTPRVFDLYGLDAQNLGFGYNTWCGRDDGYYRLEGLYSQFAFMYPRENACIVITCNDITHKKIFDLVDKYFPMAFRDNLPQPEEGAVERLKELLDSFSYDVLEVSPRNFATEAALNGRTYKLFPQKAATMLPLSSVYMLAERPGYMNNLKLEFSDDYGKLTWDEKTAGQNTLCVNFDGGRRVSVLNYGKMLLHALAFGKWHHDSTLEIQIFLMEIPEIRTLKIRFKKNKIRISNTLSPNLYETLDNKYRFEGMKTNIILDVVAKLSNIFGNIVFCPPKLWGKLDKKDK